MTANPLMDLCAKHSVEPYDWQLAQKYVPDGRAPDLKIAPDGELYLARWYVVPRNGHGNVYFHLQVANDPERPLHDHPWDNTSILLAGGYREIIWDPKQNRGMGELEFRRDPGDVVHRPAEWAHRLFLPAGTAYSMSLFVTGPHRRDWGFWFPDGWRSHSEVIVTENGQSVFKGEMG